VTALEITGIAVGQASDKPMGLVLANEGGVYLGQNAKKKAYGYLHQGIRSNYMRFLYV
jgi:hypothetical protein